MKRNEIVSLVLVAGVLMLSFPVFGHHGTNISYDHDKPTKLEGVVTEFVWANPHAQIYFDVADANGNIVRWGGELNSPGVLSRAGWNRNTLKAGDTISLTVFPSKAGTPVGVVDRSQPVLANGNQVLGTGEQD